MKIKDSTIERLRHYAPKWADILANQHLYFSRIGTWEGLSQITRMLRDIEGCVVGECRGSGLYYTYYTSYDLEANDKACLECSYFAELFLERSRLFSLGLSSPTLEAALIQFLDHFEAEHK